MLKVSYFENATEFDEYPAGQTLFEEGDIGATMYGVREGEVEIRIGERLLETVRPGGIFGEMSLIDDSPRMATAVTKTACKVVEVDEARFYALVRKTPIFALEVMRFIAYRLRRETYLGE